MKIVVQTCRGQRAIKSSFRTAHQQIDRNLQRLLGGLGEPHLHPHAPWEYLGRRHRRLHAVVVGRYRDGGRRREGGAEADVSVSESGSGTDLDVDPTPKAVASLVGVIPGEPLAQTAWQPVKA